MSRVAEALREARIAAGLSQKDVGRALGVSQPFLNDVEHGRRKLSERHYGNLPEPVRTCVVRVAIADLQRRISVLRELIRR